MCADAIRSPEMLLSRGPQRSRNLENKFLKGKKEMNVCAVCRVGTGGVEGRRTVVGR